MCFAFADVHLVRLCDDDDGMQMLNDGYDTHIAATICHSHIETTTQLTTISNEMFTFKENSIFRLPMAIFAAILFKVFSIYLYSSLIAIVNYLCETKRTTTTNEKKAKEEHNKIN